MKYLLSALLFFSYPSFSQKPPQKDVNVTTQTNNGTINVNTKNDYKTTKVVKSTTNIDSSHTYLNGLINMNGDNPTLKDNLIQYNSYNSTNEPAYSEVEDSLNKYPEVSINGSNATVEYMSVTHTDVVQHIPLNDIELKKILYVICGAQDFLHSNCVFLFVSDSIKQRVHIEQVKNLLTHNGFTINGVNNFKLTNEYFKTGAPFVWDKFNGCITLTFIGF